jgi:polysaccharide biosynthesis transport protein
MATNEQPESELHFLDYWRVIRARKEVVLTVIILVVMSGVFYTLRLPKTYMASSRILVREDAPDRPVFERQYSVPYNPFFLRTQYEIIQSKDILQQVVDDLGLAKRWASEEGVEGGVLDKETALGLLRHSLRVSQFRDTSLLDIQVYREDPREAADIANRIAEVYRTYRMAENRNEIQRAVDALRDQLAKQQGEVEKAEDELEKIRSSTQYADINRGYTPEKARISELERSYLDAQVDAMSRESRYKAVSGKTGDDAVNTALYMVNDPTLSQLHVQLVSKEVQLKELLQNYGDNHPEVKQARAAVAQLQADIDSKLKGLTEALRTDYFAAAGRVQVLSNNLEEAKTAMIKASATKQLPFERAERNVTTRREILNALLARVTQEGIELGASRTPVTVIETAEAPLRPVGPRMTLNVLLSVVLGVLMGVGLAYFIEYLDTSVKTVDDVERLLGLPVLGVVPQKVRPLVEEGHGGPHSEVYRVLRTNMLFSRKDRGAATVAVVSAGAGEGKSTTLFNLAYTCAGMGDRVLIIDSDLRRPVQHTFLDTDNRQGLADVLVGRIGIDEAIRTTGVTNLDFLPSGKHNRLAIGQLDSPVMRDLLAQLKTRYAYVFLDTPPVVGVSDASILASTVDAVLLVVQYRKYPRQITNRARRMLQIAGCNVLGVVLNNINILRDDYYYYSSNEYEPAADAPAKKARQPAPAGKDAL